MESPKKPDHPEGKTPREVNDDRPGVDAAGPISGSVPRAGPALTVDEEIAAILAEAQEALLKGDAQKATDLFTKATDLGKAKPKGGNQPAR